MLQLMIPAHVVINAPGEEGKHHWMMHRDEALSVQKNWTEQLYVFLKCTLPFKIFEVTTCVCVCV